MACSSPHQSAQADCTTAASWSRYDATTQEVWTTWLLSGGYSRVPDVFYRNFRFDFITMSAPSITE
jgi:hypothetical protein